MQTTRYNMILFLSAIHNLWVTCASLFADAIIL